MRGMWGTGGMADRAALVAAMIAPIAIPPRSHAAGDHPTTEITAAGRDAPGARPVAPSAPGGHTAHRRTADEHMTVLACPVGLADEAREVVPSGDRIGFGAGMPARAGSIHLARGYAGETKARAL